MARFLIAATAVPGHVLPLLAVPQHLVGRGHEVVGHTGSVFRERAEATGARFVPFRPEIDIDYRQPGERVPDRRNTPPGPAQFCFGLQHLFADAIPHQSAGIADIHRDSPLDAIIVDTMFCGTFPLLLGGRETRVPIVALGITALGLSTVPAVFSVEALPPPRTLQERARNVVMNGQ